MTRIRRTALAVVVALALPLPLIGASAAFAAPAPAAPVTSATVSAASEVSGPSAAQARLPRPTGPHAVGRGTLHLVDEQRQDPWVPAAGARELMVSMYYPARPGTGGPPAPYLTTEEARLLLQEKVPGSAFPPERLAAVRTWAHPDARPAPGRFPLVVLSPGFTLPRATLTGLAEDLASRGYVVALVDHTYEAAGISFPDGRTLTCAICEQPPAGGEAAITGSRAKDVSFVLDRLTGRHPGWQYARMIDTTRIGMAGHSAGGAATLTTMAADNRVRAGVNMDGTFWDEVPAQGLNGRPFLMLGEETSGQDQSWQHTWTSLDGWRRWLSVNGTNHGSFTDLPVLAALVGVGDPDEISPERAEQLTRTCVAAFFDQSLKGIAQPLLDGPSPANPEVVVRLP
ncbi:alpha/beta hydrolase family protein [Kitasatospora sp. NPDC088548]|uniref:alpha/beta hydrolase family protein n=1 Tax=Kitasatospora sp. NPDC088548 TaxID=3364075 RepID=UPI00381EF24C